MKALSSVMEVAAQGVMMPVEMRHTVPGVPRTAGRPDRVRVNEDVAKSAAPARLMCETPKPIQTATAMASEAKTASPPISSRTVRVGRPPSRMET